MRIAAGLEYDGTKFCGWQIQDGVETVQAHVERALSKVADHPVRVACAGRTDTAVHALGQVIHFDSEAPRAERSWVFGANANLPKEIALRWARPVEDDFHARFSARRRWYRYIILNRPVRPTFLAWRVAWDYRPLDEHKMAHGAEYLIGEHDFTSYRAQGCQAKHPVRTIYRLEVRRKEDLVTVDVEANAFLHHMVRNIAGVLMTIGAGEKPPQWAKQVLDVCDRAQGGITAPAHGLYFMDVRYPNDYDLPRLSPTQMVW